MMEVTFNYIETITGYKEPMNAILSKIKGNFAIVLLEGKYPFKIRIIDIIAIRPIIMEGFELKTDWHEPIIESLQSIHNKMKKESKLMKQLIRFSKDPYILF